MTYGEVYSVICKWISQGKLWPQYSGLINDTSYTELDTAILNAFNIPNIAAAMEHEAAYQRAILFNRLYTGTDTFSWMRSEHALTLFKTLEVQNRRG